MCQWPNHGRLTPEELQAVFDKVAQEKPDFLFYIQKIIEDSDGEDIRLDVDLFGMLLSRECRAEFPSVKDLPSRCQRVLIQPYFVFGDVGSAAKFDEEMGSCQVRAAQVQRRNGFRICRAVSRVSNDLWDPLDVFLVRDDCPPMWRLLRFAFFGWWYEMYSDYVVDVRVYHYVFC